MTNHGKEQLVFLLILPYFNQNFGYSSRSLNLNNSFFFLRSGLFLWWLQSNSLVASEARNYFKELMVKDLMFDTEPKLSEIVLDSIIGIWPQEEASS